MITAGAARTELGAYIRGQLHVRPGFAGGKELVEAWNAELLYCALICGGKCEHSQGLFRGKLVKYAESKGRSGGRATGVALPTKTATGSTQRWDLDNDNPHPPKQSLEPSNRRSRRGAVPVATRGSWLVDGDAATPPGSSSSSCRPRDDGDASPPTATRTAAAPSAPAATAVTVCLESRGVEAVAHSCVERESLSAAPSVKEAMAKTRAKERHLLLHRTEAVL